MQFPKKLFYFSILPAVICYTIILLIAHKYNIAPLLVIRDLLQTCDYPVAVGMISNIGILFWASASAICLFVSFTQNIKRELSQLLFFGGGLSAFLCIDDFFLLHDRYINQKLLVLIYLSLILFAFFKFMKPLVKISISSLIISLLFFGMSIIIDFWFNNILTLQIFEEGFKFLGIICWFNFWCKASSFSLKFKPSLD